MLQIERRFAGVVSACPRCDGQPFHIEHRGKDLHSVECPRCQITTGKFPTTQEALAAWEAQATTQLPVERAA